MYKPILKYQGILALALLLAAGLAMTGCGKKKSPNPDTKQISITISSNLYFGADGTRMLGAVYGSFDGGVTSCAGSPNVGRLTHAGDVLITTSGTVTLPIKVPYDLPYGVSIYVDNNGSNSLTAGDRIWGSSGSLMFKCYDSTTGDISSTSQLWENLAPVAIYTGSTQPYASTLGVLPSAQDMLIPSEPRIP